AKVLLGSEHSYVVPGSVSDENRSMPMGQLVLTDADGSFAAEGVAAGAVPVQVWTVDFAPWHGGVEVAAGATARLGVAWAPGAEVTGTVHDAAGTAVAGASVASGEPYDLFARSARTGADGSYRLAGLPGGAVALRASAGKRRAVTTLELPAAARARWDPELVADPQ